MSPSPPVVVVQECSHPDAADKTGRRLRRVLITLFIVMGFLCIMGGGFIQLLILSSIYILGIVGAGARHRCLLLAYFICSLTYHGIQFILSLIVSGFLVAIGISEYQEHAGEIRNPFEDMSTAEFQVAEEMIAIGSIIFVVLLIIYIIVFGLTFYSWALVFRMRRQLKQAASSLPQYTPCPVSINHANVEMTTMPPAPVAQEVQQPVFMMQTQDGQTVFVPVYVAE